MGLTHNTVEAIDEQTLKGLSIGYYGKADDLSVIPRMLGDWNIRTIEERRCPGSGYIVAVPSNTRTRLIYNDGRKNWLKAMGFTMDLAEQYLKASWSVNRKWEHQVATFVLNNVKLDEWVLDQIITAPNPKKTGEQYNVFTKLGRAQILAGCQILKNLAMSRR